MHTNARSVDRDWSLVRTFFFALFALLVAANIGVAQEPRTWTDSTGKFTIVGKLASNDGKSVRIEKNDGKIVAIPLDKLSKSDQLFLSKATANPFQEEEASPFEPEASAMNNDAPNDPPAGNAVGAGEPRDVKFRAGFVRKLDMSPTKDEFGITVTPAPTPKLRNKPIRIPPTIQFFDGLEEMKISGNGRVLLHYGCDVRHVRRDNPRMVDGQGLEDSDRLNRYVLVDATSGKVLSEGRYGGDKYSLLAMHDDGVRFAVRKSIFGHGKSGTLELWAFNGPKSLLRGFRLEPFADSSWDPDKDVDWAQFVGDRLLVSNGKRVIALNVADLKPQYELEIGGRPAVLPDNRHLVFWRDKNLAVLDTVSGKIVCAMPMPTNFPPALGVDPQGKSLVCAGEDKITKINLQTGEVELEFATSISHHQAQGMTVLDDRYVLLPGGKMFDLQAQIGVWSFSGAKESAQLGDTTIFCKLEGQKTEGAIVCQRLPGEKLAAHLDELTKKPGFFCVEPGAKVRLDVQGLPDQQKRQEILASLSQKLEANGNVVDPNGEVTLKATIESKGPKEVSFFSGGTVTFQEYLSKLEFSCEGKTVWSRSGNNIPGILHYDRTEGLAAAAAKHNVPNYYIFERVVLPSRVARPTDGNELGSTRVTVDGLQ